MFDELETLLKEALAHEVKFGRRGKGTVTRLNEIKRICHSTYTNPDNWLEGPLVELIHKETGGYLGTFREYNHAKVAARKLVRVSEAGPAVVQYVEGDLWLGGPVQHTVDPPTEGEIAAVREYYQPRYWRPAWLHLHGRQSRRPLKSAEQLIAELMQ